MKVRLKADIACPAIACGLNTTVQFDRPPYLESRVVEYVCDGCESVVRTVIKRKHVAVNSKKMGSVQKDLFVSSAIYKVSPLLVGLMEEYEAERVKK